MSKAVNIFSLAFKRYDTALQNSPYKTKIITNALIFATGDIVTQMYIEKNPNHKFNLKRTLAMAFIGGPLAAPFAHLWYCKWVPSFVKNIKNDKLKVVVSVLADQLIFTPPLMTSFLFLNDFMLNWNVKKAANNVREKFWRGLKTNWTVWPPVQFINFWLMPIQFRVPFVNFVGLFWSMYLSHLQNN